MATAVRVGHHCRRTVACWHGRKGMSMVGMGDVSRTATTFDVKELVERAWRGDIRVPRFQRELRWKWDDAKKLFDSIMQNSPIGSLLLWSGPAPQQVLQLGALHVEAPEINEHFETASRITQKIREYSVPAYTVEHDDERVLQDIFDRMKNYGNRLTKAEAFSALNAGDECSAKDRLGFPLIAGRVDEERSFGAIDDGTVLRVSSRCGCPEPAASAALVLAGRSAGPRCFRRRHDRSYADTRTRSGRARPEVRRQQAFRAGRFGYVHPSAAAFASAGCCVTGDCRRDGGASA